MNNSINKLLLLLFTISLIGCAQLAKHIDTIKPTAKVTGMHIASINFDKVDLVFDLTIENQNPVTLNLAGLDYELKIENQSLLSGVTARAIKIKAKSTSPVQLPITLKFSDLKKLSGKLLNKDKLAYDLKTTLNINLPVIGNYAILVSKQGELPLPKIPSIKIKSIKIKDLSVTSVYIITQVEINNPNIFNLALSDFNYQLNVNQKKWARGKIKQNYKIPKKGKGIIEIPITLDLLTMGKSTYKLLLNKAPLEYQLTGSASLDTGLELLKKQNIPLDIKGTTSLR